MATRHQHKCLLAFLSHAIRDNELNSQTHSPRLDHNSVYIHGLIYCSERILGLLRPAALPPCRPAAAAVGQDGGRKYHQDVLAQKRFVTRRLAIISAWTQQQHQRVCRLLFLLRLYQEMQRSLIQTKEQLYLSVWLGAGKLHSHTVFFSEWCRTGAIDRTNRTRHQVC